MNEIQMQSIVVDLVKKYGKKLGVNLPLNYSLNTLTPQCDYNIKTGVLSVNVKSFVRLYYEDKSLAFKFLKWSIAHELNHVRQAKVGMLRTVWKLDRRRDILEADSDFVAERLTGIKPIDVHEMVIRLKSIESFKNIGDYFGRQRDWTRKEATDKEIDKYLREKFWV